MHNATFSSDITVELIKHSASDQDVIYAARVSTQGERSKENLNGFSMDQVDRDAGLINYLMRERHGSPFEHSYFTFYVKAPIFVWREHMRHRIASYNEESGRYKVLEPEFYVPSRDRKLVQIGKTGHYEFIEGDSGQYAILLTTLRRNCESAYTDYLQLLNNGIAKEVARMVLPVNIYSSAYVTMNARALMNFLSLRRHVDGSLFPSYPQREIEIVAEEYEKHFSDIMPITYEAFQKNRRVAP
jgi:thymidylate synthase (FAD)